MSRFRYRQYNTWIWWFHRNKVKSMLLYISVPGIVLKIFPTTTTVSRIVIPVLLGKMDILMDCSRRFLRMECSISSVNPTSLQRVRSIIYRDGIWSVSAMMAWYLLFLRSTQWSRERPPTRSTIQYNHTRALHTCGRFGAVLSCRYNQTIRLTKKDYGFMDTQKNNDQNVLLPVQCHTVYGHTVHAEMTVAVVVWPVQCHIYGIHMVPGMLKRQQY